MRTEEKKGGESLSVQLKVASNNMHHSSNKPFYILPAVVGGEFNV